MLKNFLTFLFVCFQIFSVFSQEINLKFEEKYPVKAVSLSNEFFEFTNSQAVKYNKYDQKIYLLDKRSHQIAVFDTALTFIKSSRKLFKGPLFSFPWPGAITFDNTGRLIFADFPKGKIQVLDTDFNIISEFGDFFMYEYSCADMKANSQNFIYFHFPGNRFLFIIYDINGKEIDRFGKINRKSIIPDESNSVTFTIDENDNLYFMYRAIPRIFKYDKYHNNVFSKDIDFSDYRNLFIKKNQKFKMFSFEPPKGFKFISVDNMNIYTGIYQESNLVFVFDKNTCIPVKLFHLKMNGRFDNFEFGTKNYFYTVDEHNKLLVKFRK